MKSTVRRSDNALVAPKDFSAAPGLARMTDVVDRNEKAYWLLQVRLTPYNASHCGRKYDPASWSGTPLIRVIWVNRGGRLAEYQEWLNEGQEVQVPCNWELSVDEAIFTADQYSALGYEQTVEWMREARETSTLIEDAVTRAEQLSVMVQNRSTFGPAGKVQRNGFSHELRDLKLRESNQRWRD